MKKLIVVVIVGSFMLSLIGCSKQKDESSNIPTIAVSTDETEEAGPDGTEEVGTDDTVEASTEETVEASTEETITYKDGTYEVESEIDGEGYYTKATVVIKDGAATEVEWEIFDSIREDRPFDETYEEVFVGDDYYMQQSRDDWKGSREYSSNFIETQDVEEVDAVSGATWTNKKFKEIVLMAMEQAKN